MAEIKLRNGTDHEFTDISSETFRVYHFPGGETVQIFSPQYLNVGRSGHRVLDGFGYSHFIPKGWTRLTWKVKEDQPHFVR
ncbi:MAG: hypothetical protein GF334_03060 [Candidatus Altiarchaeales archaeon]|nr:hypothetical protein [Candidatus Altiarchaeales archaeon]